MKKKKKKNFERVVTNKEFHPRKEQKGIYKHGQNVRIKNEIVCCARGARGRGAEEENPGVFFFFPPPTAALGLSSIDRI